MGLALTRVGLASGPVLAEVGPVVLVAVVQAARQRVRSLARSMVQVARQREPQAARQWVQRAAHQRVAATAAAAWAPATMEAGEVRV